jgi:S1-C subfamily serine protease
MEGIMAKKAKKLVLLGLIIVMCFGLTACSLFFGEDGKSAYEIAIENGFIGTESEWLASLKGSSGKNGADGADAPQETIEDIYAAYQNRGGELSFEDFLKEFLSGYGEGSESGYGGSDTSYAGAVALRSTVAVHAYFSGSGSAGAGVIFSLDRSAGSAYIITNYHVVYDGTTLPSKIEIFLYGKENFSAYAINASLIGGSAEYDVAVLFVASNNQLKSEFVIEAAIADSDAIHPGDTVLAVGNPSDLGLSVTAGIVSQDSQMVTMERLDGISGNQQMRLIRIDAPVNSGNSGGGLFNDRGELTGIVNGKMVSVFEDDDGNLVPTNIENIAYAIPTNAAVAVAENIRDNNNGKGSKIVLGVTLTASSVESVYDEETQRVNIIHKVSVLSVGQFALARGKLYVSDEILNVKITDSANNVKISKDIVRFYQPTDILLNVRAGDKMIFTIKRGNNTLTVTIEAASSSFQIF